MGRLGPKERRFLAEILYGFITRNYQRTAEVHFEAGYVPPHHSVEAFAQAIRAIGEPIHNRAADEISMAKLLMLLFEVTGLFDMRTRPELLLLQKTMVVVEGVARSLDPQARHVDGRRAGGARMDRAPSRPGRTRSRTPPKARVEVGRVLSGVPALMSRGAALIEHIDAITRDGLVLAPETVAAIGAAEQKRNRWTAIALWAIAILLGVAGLAGAVERGTQPRRAALHRGDVAFFMVIVASNARFGFIAASLLASISTDHGVHVARTPGSPW